MIGAIIQARIGSTRLPGKCLMDINGKPMLQRVIERTSKSRLVEKIVVATSQEPKNKAIVNLVNYLGFPIYEGSENDVLNRYYRAATDFKIDHIVRITGNCPLIDPVLIDITILLGVLREKHVDYICCVPPFPEGMEVEVIKYSALKRCHKEATSTEDREHVTKYIRDNPDKYTSHLCDKIRGVWGFHLSVDTLEDLDIARAVYLNLGPDFTFDELMKFVGESNAISKNATKPQCQ